jgi:hypothetical protein
MEAAAVVAVEVQHTAGDKIDQNNAFDRPRGT